MKLWVRGQKHAETCLERCRVFHKTWYLWFSIKRFYSTGLFPYLLKTLENLRFSKVPGGIETSSMIQVNTLLRNNFWLMLLLNKRWFCWLYISIINLTLNTNFTHFLWKSNKNYKGTWKRKKGRYRGKSKDEEKILKRRSSSNFTLPLSFLLFLWLVWLNLFFRKKFDSGSCRTDRFL